MKKTFLKCVILAIVIVIAGCTQNKEAKNNQGNGLTKVISDTNRIAACVSFTSDINGIPIISWAEVDSSSGKKFFKMSVFDNQKNQFAAPINIPIKQSTSIHEEGIPKIAVKGDGSIMAFYETSEPTKENPYAGFIYYTISADGGKSWSAPQYLDQDSEAGTSHSFASVCRMGDGELAACWLGNSILKNGEGRPVIFAKTQAGKGFQNQIIIDSLACECCRIAIGSNAENWICVFYRDLLPGSVRDISMSISQDAGLTFSKPRTFSDDGWRIEGCPHNGPSISLNKNDVSATWFTGGSNPGIYFGKQNLHDGGIQKIRLSREGRFAQVTTLPDGTALIVYNKLYMNNGKVCSPIVIEKISNENTTSSTLTSSESQAGYPVIQAISKNVVIAAWVENNSIKYKLVNIHDIVDPAILTEEHNQNPNNKKEIPDEMNHHHM